MISNKPKHCITFIAQNCDLWIRFWQKKNSNFNIDHTQLTSHKKCQRVSLYSLEKSALAEDLVWFLFFRICMNTCNKAQASFEWNKNGNEKSESEFIAFLKFILLIAFSGILIQCKHVWFSFYNEGANFTYILLSIRVFQMNVREKAPLSCFKLRPNHHPSLDVKK